MRPPFKRRDFLKLSSLALGATALKCGGRGAGLTAQRPNIIVIFADDLGFSDIGCFGGEIETPHLDSLAAGGVRATQFYTTARCCPSRVSLLTGLYPHQAGMGLMVYRDYGEGYRGNLNDRCITFGDLLSQAGYRTMLVGKWHAGHAPESKPEVRGFQHFTGIYTHIDSYWKVLAQCDIYRDGERLIPAGENPKNPYQPDQEFYTTDFFTDTALDYIQQAQRTPDRPFLLHLCYNTPHFPLEAPDELIDKYRGRYSFGWNTLREEKLSRMKELAVVTDSQQLPEQKGYSNRSVQGIRQGDFNLEIPNWDSLSENQRRELDFRRAIYAAQVERLDWNIGRLLNGLKEKGILDNTLLLFFSDNGCSGEDSMFGMNWGKFTSDNYAQWRRKGGWSISQGQGWASFSNTPLRKYKRFVHEGGIASPFIAHWPAGIKQRGELIPGQAFHLIDILPTLCQLSGAAYPQRFNGRDILPAEGISMLPYLQDVKKIPIDRTLYWQHERNAAVRRGDWKLVTTNDRDETAWELYNLSQDRSETENRINRFPDRADRLKEMWLAWARRCNVLPYPEERGIKPKSLWPPGGDGA